MGELIIGQQAGNVIVPYSQTTKRTKTVTNAELDISATSGTITYAEGFAEADQDGNWWLTCQIRATSVSVTAATFTFGSSNIVWHATNEQTGSIYSSYGGTDARIYLPPNQSTIGYYGCASNAGNYVIVSLTAKLKQEPTWAAANMEASTDASIYIEPATSTQAGVVGGSNGVAVGTGRIGEKVSGSAYGGPSFGAAAVKSTHGSITLTKGIYMVYGRIGIGIGSSSVFTATDPYIGASLTLVEGTWSDLEKVAYTDGKVATGNMSRMVQVPPSYFEITDASDIVYLQAAHNMSTTTGSSWSSSWYSLYAIRIA